MCAFNVPIEPVLGGPEIAGIIGKWLSDGADDTPGLADAADRVAWNCTQWPTS